MKININNYEEYFLLYADKELSVEERNEVENFVHEHPSLKKEFESIQFTVIIPDTEIRLMDKSFLLSNSSASFINESNCESVFVWYHDGELDDDQKKEVEKFIILHPEQKAEFELIGNAKLVADEAIVFPDKNLLFKKENLGGVVPMVLWRYLAAAVLIGFGLWFTIPLIINKNANPPIAINNNKPATTEAESNTGIVIIDKNQEEKQRAFAPAENTKENMEETIPVQNKERKQVAIVAKKQDSKRPGISQKKSAASFEETKIGLRENNVAELIPLAKNLKPVIPGLKTEVEKSESVAQIDQAGTPFEVKSQVDNSSYTVLSEETVNNENYVFYNVSTDEFNKSKVGGFLKKVKRMVERTNPIARLFSGDDNQVAVK